MNMTLCRRRSGCRLCGSEAVSLAFSLTPTPPANSFVTVTQKGSKQAIFPLDIFFCENCHHVQLLDVVDPAHLFENYVYVSGTSPVFVNHFENYARHVTKTYLAETSRNLVVDIGSNDGTLLAQFKSAGLRVLGIDPAKNIAKTANAKGIETIPKFFSAKLAREIRHSYGAAHAICANNVFAHADDLADISNGIRLLLAPDGVFVFEVSYLVDVFEKTLFDTIYHEHLAYHSVSPLRRFFTSIGMELISATRIKAHGGSLRGVAQLEGGPHHPDGSVETRIKQEVSVGLDKVKTLRGFGDKVDRIKIELNRLLEDLKSAGNSIAGFGAPAKATTLLYHFGIGPEIIDFIVDDSPLKQGLFSPGMHIPVLPPDAIYDRKPDALVILAWNFANSIMAKHSSYAEQGGRFIVPLPEVVIH